MPAPGNKGYSSNGPEKEPDELGIGAADLPDPEPPDDAEGGAGIFQEGIEGDEEFFRGYGLG
jgi:hypothetical protein